MKRAARGLTLIETLIASALLFVLIAGVMIVLQMLMNSIGEARLRLIASSLAMERLEMAKNLPFDRVGTIGGIPEGDLEQSASVDFNGQVFEITTGVVFVDDPFDDLAPTDPIPTDYKRVRVTVDWSGLFQPKTPFVMATDIAPPGIESIEGAGTLLINVFDSLGAAVSSAEVTIQAPTLDPPIDLVTTTNSSGQVLLPGAPICIECYHVSVTKPGYSTDKTYTSAEVANPAKPLLSVLEADLTQASFAIDRTATLTVRTTRSRQANYAAFQGVQFMLRGNKVIGTDTFDNPVYKYENNYTSGALGQLVIPNLEWDLYHFALPTGSSIDIAGTVPLNPFILLAGSSQTITVVTTANTTNSLLVSVQNAADTLLADAIITLFDQQIPVATLSAGPADKGDFGQAYFGSLTTQPYDILVTLTGHQDATGSVIPNGDIREAIILNSL